LNVRPHPDLLPQEKEKLSAPILSLVKKKAFIGEKDVDITSP
jgi:hypothetical protein